MEPGFGVDLEGGAGGLAVQLEAFLLLLVPDEEVRVVVFLLEAFPLVEESLALVVDLPVAALAEHLATLLAPQFGVFLLALFAQLVLHINKKNIVTSIACPCQ